MTMKGELEVQAFAADFYEESRYQKEYSRYYHDWWNRKMVSLTSKRGKILDNGCGTGILLETLRDIGFIVGSDISHKMLKYAKARSNDLVLGDSQSLPFRDEHFDVVLGRSLLHHLPEPVRGIGEMARVLKKGGEMVVVDTNRSLLSALPRYLAKKGEHFSDEHKNMEADELIDAISRFFAIDRVLYFGYFAYPLGFPDMFDIGKYLPYPLIITKSLIMIDSFISKLPILKKQSWGIMIKAHKR